MERKSQLALEFLAIVAVGALALAFSVALLFGGFSGIERAALGRNAQEVEDFLSFAGKAGGPGAFSLKKGLRVFPTGELAIFSGKGATFVATCGKFSGFSEKIVSEEFLSAELPEGFLQSGCSRGRFSSGKGLSGKLVIRALGSSRGERVISVEKAEGESSR